MLLFQTVYNFFAYDLKIENSSNYEVNVFYMSRELK